MYATFTWPELVDHSTMSMAAYATPTFSDSGCEHRRAWFFRLFTSLQTTEMAVE
jgi:hypothetical protein